MNPLAWKTWVLIITGAAVVGLYTFGSIRANAVECNRETPCRIV